MYNEEINTLIHAGKKGMKWGVRKDRTSSDYQTVRPLRKKSASKLSNDELKKVVSRMQLEKQYNSINPRGTKKAIGKAAAVVGAVVATGATIGKVSTFAKSPAGQSIAKGIVERLSINFDNLKF
jgi:glycerol-3-phosphate dehydrogenase